MFNIIPVQFGVANWNLGLVEANAKLDLHTGEVFDIERSDENEAYDSRDSEYITAVEGKVSVNLEVGPDKVYRVATGNELAAIRNHFIYVQ